MTMDRELARKRPAAVLDRQVAPEYPRTVTYRAGVYQKAELVKRVRRMHQAGRIGHTYRLEQDRAGWSMTVVELGPPRGWWARHWPVACLVTGAALILASLLFLLARLLIAAAPVLVGGAVALALFSLASGGAVTVIQKVTVNR